MSFLAPFLLLVSSFLLDAMLAVNVDSVLSLCNSLLIKSSSLALAVSLAPAVSLHVQHYMHTYRSRYMYGAVARGVWQIGKTFLKPLVGDGLLDHLRLSA